MTAILGLLAVFGFGYGIIAALHMMIAQIAVMSAIKSGRLSWAKDFSDNGAVMRGKFKYTVALLIVSLTWPFWVVPRLVVPFIKTTIATTKIAYKRRSVPRK